MLKFRFRSFYFLERNPVPIEQEDAWTPERVRNVNNINIYQNMVRMKLFLKIYEMYSLVFRVYSISYC
jgi:hypothetical protein